MNEKIKEYNISLEVLRIVSMCMIITLHFFTYSNAVIEVNDLSLQGIIKTIIHSICNVSVNCYILISGYFCIRSKFKITKLYKIISEVCIYSMLIYILMVSNNIVEFNIKELIFNFFPTLTRQYWFVTCYIGVYICSPIIRVISNKLNNKEHKLILIIGLLLFVVYYNLFFFCDNLNFGGATGIVWFAYLYFWGIYFQKYYEPNYTKRNLLEYFSVVILALLSRIPFYLIFIFTKKDIFLTGASIFDSVYNSIFTFISSIFLFKLFLNIKINKFKISFIRFLSSSTFAIYILHENKYLREVIWHSINFKNIVGLSIIKMILAIVIVVITVFGLGLIVDKVVKYILNKTIWSERVLKIVDKLSDSLWKKVNDKFIF